MTRWPIVAGGAVAAIAVVLMLLPTLQITSTPLSAWGSDDDDVSLTVNGLVGAGFEVRSLVLGPAGLQGLDQGRADLLYLAVGVDRGYSGSEVDQLFDFVRDGGHALILDDTGASGAVLDRVGVARGSLILSTTGDEASVVEVTMRGHLVDMWEPARLDVTNANVTVLARTGNLTARDVNSDGEIGPEEPACSPGCVVAFETAIGTGKLTYIADTTFATNRYAERSGVIDLVQTLASDATTGRRAIVVVDESRHVVGPSEVGLTVFRTALLPLGVDWVPWTLATLIGAVTVVGAVRRGSETWAPHDPGLDEPYLPPDAFSSNGGGDE